MEIYPPVVTSFTVKGLDCFAFMIVLAILISPLEVVIPMSWTPVNKLVTGPSPTVTTVEPRFTPYQF